MDDLSDLNVAFAGIFEEAERIEESVRTAAEAWLMQAGGNMSVSEIISTYVYKTGLQSAQYSFATAVGLFNSVVNFIILVLANIVSKKTADISIF